MAKRERSESQLTSINGRQKSYQVKMAGRTEVEAYGRQNWQANSCIRPLFPMGWHMEDSNFGTL